jgi:hypothetical protein
MNTTFTNYKGTLNVVLDGRLDTTTAPALEDFLAKKYSGEGPIVIDCEKLTYVRFLRGTARSPGHAKEDQGQAEADPRVRVGHGGL